MHFVGQPPERSFATLEKSAHTDTGGGVASTAGAPPGKGCSVTAGPKCRVIDETPCICTHARNL